MTTHAEARELACHAIALALHLDIPPDHMTRHLAGVGSLETQYGAGWRGAGKGSNNMGAIQAGSGWTGATFEYVDTHPNADGTSTKYAARFRAYPTQLDGWADLARVMLTGKRADVAVVARLGRRDSFGRRFEHETHHHSRFAGFGFDGMRRIL